jgi:hypothetical protein
VADGIMLIDKNRLSHWCVLSVIAWTASCVLLGIPIFHLGLGVSTIRCSRILLRRSFRFYALYDKVYRKDVLTFAYKCCKANGGAAEVDNQTFKDIEAYGEERCLDELTQELKSRTYRPLPVRRVFIP